MKHIARYILAALILLVLNAHADIPGFRENQNTVREFSFLNALSGNTLIDTVANSLDTASDATFLQSIKEQLLSGSNLDTVAQSLVDYPAVKQALSDASASIFADHPEQFISFGSTLSALEGDLKTTFPNDPGIVSVAMDEFAQALAKDPNNLDAAINAARSTAEIALKPIAEPARRAALAADARASIISKIRGKIKEITKIESLVQTMNTMNLPIEQRQEILKQAQRTLESGKTLSNSEELINSVISTLPTNTSTITHDAPASSEPKETRAPSDFDEPHDFEL